jgi:[protein-PII] uridylyltransferase
MDTFFVLDSSGQPITEDSARLAHIKEYLSENLSKETGTAVSPARRTPRKMKSFAIPTETRISVDEARNVSVLEVSTPDRPGLLARLGRIFESFSVELQAAKIQTLGERVEDVFFITDAHQQALTDPKVCNALQRTICDELDEQAAA